MIWIARLCGILAATYLAYLASDFPQNSAEAADVPVMAMAVSGEMMPAMDAVIYNGLNNYEQSYPAFPQVLENTRWAYILDDAETCSANPRKLWSFSEGEDAGRVCSLKASSNNNVYSCEETNIFGRKVMKEYTIKFGDPILPDWALDRPHVTLQRAGWRKKTIGLKMCDA